jgi:hypothetical protein
MDKAARQTRGRPRRGRREAGRGGAAGATHDLADERDVFSADEEEADGLVREKAARANALARVLEHNGAELVIRRERPEEELAVAQNQEERLIELARERRDATEEDVIRRGV